MKTLGLWCVLVFTLGVVSFAQEPAAQNPRPDSQFANAQAKTDLVLNADSNFFGDSADHNCAYMRTYRVKKVPGSDAVVPSGYTTCVPVNRFQMRTTVMKKTVPAVDQGDQ